MNYLPKISVLIANYNNGKFLSEAINSVLNQSYTNWEIVIVDDGSTDNSKELYSKLEDPRIRIFNNERNFGVAFTKDRCIREAIGEICGFLDPDDFLEQQALSVMHHVMMQDSRLSLVYSNFYWLNENGLKKPALHDSTPAEFKLLVGLNPNPFSCFRRKAYSQTKGIDLNLKRAIDRDLVLKLEEVGSVGTVPDYLYNYRIYGQSVSNGFNSLKAEYWAWVARYSAMDRRGLNKEETYKIIQEYLYPIQFNDWVHKSSTEYRIGKVVAKPIRYRKNLFKCLKK